MSNSPLPSFASISLVGLSTEPEDEDRFLRLAPRRGYTRHASALGGVTGNNELGASQNPTLGESGGVQISIRSGDGDTDISYALVDPSSF